MFGSKNLGFVIYKEKAGQVHHFMDLAASEEVARKSVEKHFRGQVEFSEEMVNQFGCVKKITCKPKDGSEQVIIGCLEPTTEPWEL